MIYEIVIRESHLLNVSMQLYVILCLLFISFYFVMYYYNTTIYFIIISLFYVICDYIYPQICKIITNTICIFYNKLMLFKATLFTWFCSFCNLNFFILMLAIMFFFINFQPVIILNVSNKFLYHCHIISYYVTFCMCCNLYLIFCKFLVLVKW